MTGYKGRVGIYEMLEIDATMRDAMQGSSSLSTVRKTALAQGWRPLRLSGAIKIAEGVTTLEEVMKAAPSLD